MPSDTDDFAAPIKTPLTEREQQTALMLAVGHTNAEVAKKFKISIKTVDTHRGHLLKKLKLRNNVELARHALRENWVTL